MARRTFHRGDPRGMWRGLLALLVLAGLARPALAGRAVAVLDLDGYGVSWDVAQVMTRGLRDGFLEDGTLDPVDVFQVGDRLTAGHEEELKQAREMLVQARQRMDAGDNAGALRLLAQTLEIHDASWSWISRRPELADAHYFTAVALVRQGRQVEAVSHLVETLFLYPGYDSARAVNATPEIRSLFANADSVLREGERRSMAGPQMATVGEAARCEYEAAGWVAADGTILVRLYEGDVQVSEASATAQELPVYPGDPVFEALVSQLLQGRGIEPVAAVPAPSVEEIGEFHEIPTVEVELPEEEPLPPPAATSRASAGRIRSRGSIRYDRPVTEQWWFWTGVSAVVVGTGVVVWVGMQEPEPEPEPAQRDSYTVTLDPSGLGAR